MLLEMTDWRARTTRPEVAGRVIAGECYFAAHHVARALLRLRGKKPEKWKAGEAHQQVITGLYQEFAKRGDLSLKAYEGYRRLYAKRTKAHYRLAEPFVPDETDSVLRALQRFLTEAQRIRQETEGHAQGVQEAKRD
jgi:uncharacterized protein (UPF0332 family)